MQAIGDAIEKLKPDNLNAAKIILADLGVANTDSMKFEDAKAHLIKLLRENGRDEKKIEKMHEAFKAQKLVN